MSSALNLPPIVWSEPQLERIHERGLAFLAEFLEIEIGRHPDNVDALAELGHVYTRQGRLQEGLAIDHRLVGLVPDNPTVYYNLACSQALLGDKKAALESLEQAVSHGYDDGKFLREDTDLASLHAEPRFRALVSQLTRNGSGGPPAPADEIEPL